MTDNYISEYNLNLIRAREAVTKGNNVILRGPERSGKTHIRKQLKDLLTDYEVYYGIAEYKNTNKMNGRHYSNKKFWIEEQNKNPLENVLEDYEFIQTNLTYNR